MAWLAEAMPKLLPCQRIGVLWLDSPARELVNVPQGSQVRGMGFVGCGLHGVLGGC